MDSDCDSDFDCRFADYQCDSVVDETDSNRKMCPREGESETDALEFDGDARNLINHKLERCHCTTMCQM